MSLIFTPHWPKQFLWPCMTAKEMVKWSQTLCLRRRKDHGQLSAALIFSNHSILICGYSIKPSFHLCRAEISTLLVIKNLPAIQETQVQSLDQRRSHGEGNSNLLHYSCLENSMGRGALWATVHGVTKNWTGLSD